jgi:hypothetical protein
MLNFQVKYKINFLIGNFFLNYLNYKFWIPFFYILINFIYIKVDNIFHNVGYKNYTILILTICLVSNFIIIYIDEK